MSGTDSVNTHEDPRFAELAGRTFAFFPAVRNIEHNEWTLEKETWSEVLAKNARTGQEIWVPRSHIGKVSSADTPILIVGLLRELQFKGGGVSPFRQQVVSMPSPGGASRPAVAGSEPPPPKRSNSAADRQTFSFIGKALLAGLAVVLLFVMFNFSRGENPIAALFRGDTSTTDQRYLGLTNADSYHLVVSKIGQPEREEWLSLGEADLQFQALWYPGRKYLVILMGGTRADVRYIGTLHDPSRKVLDAARLSRGGDTSSLLHNLPNF
jgi:hypothetical protein